MKETEKSENFTSNDDKIDWSKQYEIVDKISVKGYLQRHFEECKYIWRNMVPKSGQANNLQGEMLRMAEKLRNEAVDNGNYASKYANGEITDDQVDICKLAYTDDDIYNYLEDAIAEYYLVHKSPISYEIKDCIYR